MRMETPGAHARGAGQADPYAACPQFENERFLLRLVRLRDAEDLLRVYADPAAQEIIQDCGAWNCDFGYGAQTPAAMRACVQNWLAAYAMRGFIRMTIVDKQTGRAAGTIEAYKRGAAEAFFPNRVCLRIDLHSAYETRQTLDALLALILPGCLRAFQADGVFTRATPVAAARAAALRAQGFTLTDAVYPDSHGWGVTYADFYDRACAP